MTPADFDLTLTMPELKALGWSGIERWVCDRIDERFPGYEITEFDWMPWVHGDSELVISIAINEFHELDRNPLSPHGRTGKRGE